MKLVKLHQAGREMLVNLSSVSEVYPVLGKNKSDLHLNFAINGDQVSFRVDESLDEILNLSNCEFSGQRSENNQEPDRSIEAPEMQYVRESYDPPFEKDLDAKPAYWSVEKEYGYCFLW